MQKPEIEGYITLEEYNNRIDYERNVAVQQVKTYGDHYRRKMNNELRLDLTAIEEMLEYVQEPEKSRIEKRIARIRATLAKND